LGEQILVSAITTDTEIKTVVFPGERRWIDYWDEATYFEGGITAQVHVPLERYPIYIQAGAILPLQVRNAVTGHGDESSAGKTTFAIYPFGASSFTFHRPLSDGTEYSDVQITVDEGAGTITVLGSTPGDYRFRIKSFTSPESVMGANRWYYDIASKTIIVDRLGDNFSIKVLGWTGYSGAPAARDGSKVSSIPVPGGKTVFAPLVSNETWKLIKPLCQADQRNTGCRPTPR
jgi:hypothetical protein